MFKGASFKTMLCGGGWGVQLDMSEWRSLISAGERLVQRGAA